jgi:hypothetical protein
MLETIEDQRVKRYPWALMVALAWTKRKIPYTGSEIPLTPANKFKAKTGS